MTNAPAIIPPPLPQLTVIPASSWEGKTIEQQEWLVEGMIPMLTTTSLSGDGGLGKSLLAMQLMTCGGAGKRFLNRDTKPFVSIGLFCEDRENQLHERQSKINQHYQVDYKDLVDVNYIPRVGEDNSLINIDFGKPSLSPFYHQFRQCVLDIGAKLVVVDTAADTFSGNENARKEVRFYIQSLNALAQDIHGAVLLLVHPSLSGLTTGAGTSGSTAWSNSVRSRWYLEKQKEQEGEEQDSNIRVLSQKKSNYSAVDTNGTELKWEDGIFRLLLDESSLFRKMEMNQLKDKCLEVIITLHSQNMILSFAKRSSTYFAPIIREKLKAKYSFKDIINAVNQLLDDKMIENVPYGAACRNLCKIIPVS